MHCYNHPDRNAVGFCKGCCKGLCHECGVDLGHGLACRGHEQRVEELEKLMSGTASLQDKIKLPQTHTSLIYLFLGAAFLGYSLFFSEGNHLLTVLGAGFLGFGLLELFASRKSKL
jgi:hypothetical protein